MLRAWREWARRWELTPRTGDFSVDQMVQPSVVIDDARSLTVPPLAPVWGFAPMIPASFGNFSTVIVRPNRVPIEMLSVGATIGQSIEMVWAVVDGAPPSLTVVNVLGKLQGPVGITPDATAMHGVVGTRLGNRPEYPVSAPRNGLTTTPQPPGDWLTLFGFGAPDRGPIVLPGQYWQLQLNTSNISLDLEHVIWRELPIASELGSLPRT